MPTSSQSLQPLTMQPDMARIFIKYPSRWPGDPGTRGPRAGDPVTGPLRSLTDDFGIIEVLRVRRARLKGIKSSTPVRLKISALPSRWHCNSEVEISHVNEFYTHTISLHGKASGRPFGITLVSLPWLMILLLVEKNFKWVPAGTGEKKTRYQQRLQAILANT